MTSTFQSSVPSYPVTAGGERFAAILAELTPGTQAHVLNGLREGMTIDCAVDYAITRRLIIAARISSRPPSSKEVPPDREMSGATGVEESQRTKG